MNNSTQPTKQQLRQQLRLKRRSLSTFQQQKAAIALDKCLARSGLLIRFKHIAFYLANDGEIDPGLVIKRARAMGRQCYLPVIGPNRQLRFCGYQAGDPLRRNRYGIAEPLTGVKPRKLWALGLILLPLVGFDKAGNRLGMGGGYYDRALSRNSLKLATGPVLVGLAHRCQQTDLLSSDDWDIPLAWIATDTGLIKARQTNSKQQG